MGLTASTISQPVHGLNELRVNGMKMALGIALFVLCACLDTPAPLTATVNASASQSRGRRHSHLLIRRHHALGRDVPLRARAARAGPALQLRQRSPGRSGRTNV